MLIMKFFRLICCVTILKLSGILNAVLSECHNGSDGPFGTCTCIPGFTGYNCSLRVCPSFKAWADFPSSDNVAHASYTECSNMGTCNRKTGLCKCRPGFTGPACETMMCQLGINVAPAAGVIGTYYPCSGNGRCVSLREIAEHNSSSYTDWDADRIRGCICDPGFQGVACEQRSCPKGDDPLTNGTDAVQLIDCKCSTCTGGVKILFGGRLSNLIPYDASAVLIKLRLEELVSIEEVGVTIIHGSRICSKEGSVTKVVFRLPQGNQPALIFQSSDGLIANVTAHRNGASSTIITGFSSVFGTREHEECSGRGDCTYATGTCVCYTGYQSSNGFGGAGTRGDCGHLYAPAIEMNYTQYNTTVKLHHHNTTLLTSCPFINNSICADHGTCNEETGICTCDAGYGGPSCLNMTCLSTPTWFGVLGSLGHLGTESVCGGVGYCNGTSGLCINCGGANSIFTGSRCETMSCYNSNGTRSGVCNGRGVCLTLRQLADVSYNNEKELSHVVYNTPWDADMIRGCACSRAISIDNQYDQEYMNAFPSLSCPQSLNMTGNQTCTAREAPDTQFYRGPFSYSATDYSSYNCGHSKCPHGDDPRADRGVNEIQKINCQAINGTFQLIFRENLTLPIHYNDTVKILKLKLEQLFTIREVSVSIVNGIIDSVCTQHGYSSVLVEFTTEFGTLPLLKGSTASLPHTKFNITEYQKCTKKDIECSGVGICNELTGRCGCETGYTSSNGSIYAPGSTGDCTYFNPLYTQISLEQS